MSSFCLRRAYLLFLNCFILFCCFRQIFITIFFTIFSSLFLILTSHYKIEYCWHTTNCTHQVQPQVLAADTPIRQQHVYTKCCVEHLRLMRTLQHMVYILCPYGVPMWLALGTLLGAVRHNSTIISWDLDAGMSFVLSVVHVSAHVCSSPIPARYIQPYPVLWFSMQMFS